MTTVLNKRNKRRKHKSGSPGGSKSNIHVEQQETEIMKLKPEVNEEITHEVNAMVNGHSSKQESEDLQNSSQYHTGERCQHCHKEYHNNGSVLDNSDHNLPAHGASAEQLTSSMQASGGLVQVSSSALNFTSFTACDSTSYSTTKPSYNVAKTCTCKSCIERRAIEAEHLLDTQLRHAWTQVRHLVRCAYHDPLVLAAIDSDEFKTNVDLLVSRDPHLLFYRIENTGREYVNEIKTRLLKQLTNGFNTPTLACSFINIMFDEYFHLLNSARTVSSLLRRLEEDHLCRFNNATWEQHNMHLFQSMVHSEPVIQRTFAEIVNQLRQGSTQYDSKHDNMFTATLLKYLKFDTEMTQVSVAWRDVQKLIDDFNDERVDAKRKQRRHKPSNHSETKENWDLFKVHQESYKEMLTSGKKYEHEATSESRLSLTLRKCSMPSAPTSDKVTNTNTTKNDCDASASENDAQFDSPLNSEGSFNQAFYVPQPTSKSDNSVMSFLSTDYLRNIRPPSVPSDDLDDSSENEDGSPRIIAHPSLIVPSDLEGEIDSIGSLSPQPSNNDIGHNPFLHFDGAPNNLLLNSARSFILPAFHHTPPYHPHQHLRHLHKSIHTSSDPVFSNSLLKVRPPSPNVKSKTESMSGPHLDDLNVLLPDPDIAPLLETDPSLKVPSNDSSGSTSANDAVESEHNALGSAHSTTKCLNEAIYKDSWSSSSSSAAGFFSASTLSCSDHGKTKNKHFKLKKKVQRKLKTNQKPPDKKEVKDKAKNESQAEKGDVATGLAEFDYAEYEGVEKEDDRDTNGEEDADDEYDGEDDESEEVCKCERCIATMNLCKVSDSSREYLSFSEPKAPYLMQGLDAGMSTGGASCECPSCLRLAAVSFIASQSGQPTSNLANFTPNDVSGSSINPPQTLQNHFYSPMQDLHSIIHPHLYGLPSMGTAGSLAQPSEQRATDSNTVTLTASSSMPKTPNPITHESCSVQDNQAEGHMFHHASMNPSADWDMFGKTAGGKLVMNATGQNAASPNLPEWPIPGHQAWLNGTGSASGILPSHLVAPGGVSAFQQYITSSTMAGAQGFLQPFIPGTTPLTHPGIHPPSFLNTQADDERLFCSTASSINTSSVANTSMIPSASQHTTFMSSLPSSITSVMSGSNSTSVGILSSSSTPPSSMNYFSSSIYAPVPEFASNPMPPFLSQSSAPTGDVSNMANMPQSSQHVQPIRFHPGTSVSLKEGQFSLAVQGNENLMFNSPLVPFTSSDKTNRSVTPTQPTFTSTTSSQACPQHNPFLQYIPMPCGPTQPGYPYLMAPTSAATQASITSPVSTTIAATNQIRQQILRRKKLVAQSKLSKQARPQQQVPKTPEQNSGPESNTQVSQIQASLQKVRMQVQLTMQQEKSQQNQQQSATVTSKAQQQQPATCVLSTTATTGSESATQFATTSTQCQMQPTSDIQVKLDKEHLPPAHSPTAKNKDAPSTEKCTSEKDKSIKEPEEHAHPPHQSTHPPTSDSCSHMHGADGHDASAGAGASDNATNSGSTNSNNGGGNCKYCNCCYCEFFGNGGPPPAPTSKNFHEIRERLRRKLHTNKQKSQDAIEDGKKENIHLPHPRPRISNEPNFFPGLYSAQPTVDELLTFIEGETVYGDGGKKMSKKARQKQKKEIERRNAVRNEILKCNPDSDFSRFKEVKYVLTYEPGSKEGKLVYPKPKEETVAIAESSSMGNDLSSDHNVAPDEEPAADKNSTKKKTKKPTKHEEQLLEEKSPQPVTHDKVPSKPSPANAKESKSKTSSDNQAANPKKNALSDKVVQVGKKPKTPVTSEARKMSTVKEDTKNGSSEKPASVKSKVTKSNSQLLSKPTSSTPQAQENTKPAPVAANQKVPGPKTKAVVSKTENPKKVNNSTTTTAPNASEKSLPAKQVADKQPQAKSQAQEVASTVKATPSENNSKANSSTAPNEQEKASTTTEASDKPEDAKGNVSSDEDLVPVKPQAFKKSELRRRRYIPRNYDEEQRQLYLAAVKASSLEIIKRQQKAATSDANKIWQMRNVAKLQTSGRLRKHEIERRNQRQQRTTSTTMPNGVANKKSTTNAATRQLPATQQKKPAPGKQTAREASVESLGKHTSGSSTPEKQTVRESAELKKTRTQKQRKKKGGPSSVGDGNSVNVDQVFLPREVPEEDGKDLDDAEKEIESFKRFCMDSTVLNKPKKITVNWKDFTFKKTHSSTH